MEIIVDDIRAYIIVVIMLCGELDKKILLESSSSAVYSRRAVAALKAIGLVNEKRLRGKTILRLKKPAAWKIMEGIPELKSHYETLTNEHTFKSEPPTAVQRDIQKGCMIYAALNSNMKINLIDLSYLRKRGRHGSPPVSCTNLAYVLCKLNDWNQEKIDSLKEIANHIFFENSNGIQTEENYEDVLEKVLPNDVNLFTSQIVKRYRVNKVNSPTLSINASRSLGHIIGRGNSYAIYQIAQEMIKIQIETETRYREYLFSIYQKVYGSIALKEKITHSPQGECVIFCDDIKNIKAYIRLPKTKHSNRKNLLDVYSQSYLVALNDSSSLDLLTRSCWKQELFEELFSVDEIYEAEKKLKGICDAIIGSTPAIELMSMDLNKIERTISILDADPEVEYIIYCTPKQEEVVTELFEDYENQIEIITYLPMMEERMWKNE